MKQMVNTTAPAQARMRFCELNSGSFFRLRNGRIFFAAQHGRFLVWFPVLEDGTVHHVMTGGPQLYEEVEVVGAKDIGAKVENSKTVWADENLVRDY